MNQTKVDKSKSFSERIAFLKSCAKAYEVSGTSPISDATYDEEYAALERINPDDPFFDAVGEIDELEESGYGNQIEHAYIMGSLNKSPDVDDFEQWLKRAYPAIQGLTFAIFHKVDGLSLTLKYENGKLVYAATRGDGKTGRDVTDCAKMVNGVKSTIPGGHTCEVRGECYKDKQDFLDNWADKPLNHGEAYANCRSFAAGSLNQKDPDITKQRGLSFIGYSLAKPLENEKSNLDFIDKLGIPNLSPTTKFVTAKSHAHLAQEVKKFMDGMDRRTLPYDVDGVVVKCADCSMAFDMGFSSDGRKPAAHRAVKFPPECKDTEMIGIEVSACRTGIISVVGLLKPVELGGCIIRRATMHNFSFVRDTKGIGPGCIVSIEKRGDIIPKITAVMSPATKRFDIPKTCPCCSFNLEWDENKTHLMCYNDGCKAKLDKRIRHWLENIGVKGIGKATIGILSSLENGSLIENIYDMYNVVLNGGKSSQLVRKTFGDKIFDKMQESLKSKKEITLALLIEALGIGRIGSMSSAITAIAKTPQEIDKLSESDISSIHGFGPVKARNFVSGWKSLRKEITDLIDNKFISIVQEKTAGDSLAGKKFCFTGSFSKPRGEMEETVKQYGGSSSGSVGKGVILVWDGSETGSKYNKAVAGGNTIISESDLMKMIGN